VSGIGELLDGLDLLVARAEEVAPAETVAEARRTAEHLRARWSLLTDVLVVALAGGTGSGKSSLFNALVGASLASVSAFRPHTDEALAWAAPGDPVVSRILDELGVSRRVANRVRPGIALVDLPDMDSVVSWHRRIVEELLPKVDLVVWVTDPIKYNDPTMHADFLVPIAEHEDRVVVVLNKIDLVPDAWQEVADHLRTRLIGDGFTDPIVVPVSAHTGEGISHLRSRLDDGVDVKQLVVDKLVLDVAETAAEIARAIGTWEETTLLSPGPEPVGRRVEEQREIIRRLADPVTRALLEELESQEPFDPAPLAEHLVRRAEVGASAAALWIEAALQRRRRKEV